MVNLRTRQAYDSIDTNFLFRKTPYTFPFAYAYNAPILHAALLAPATTSDRDTHLSPERIWLTSPPLAVCPVKWRSNIKSHENAAESLNGPNPHTTQRHANGWDTLEIFIWNCLLKTTVSRRRRRRRRPPERPCWRRVIFGGTV